MAGLENLSEEQIATFVNPSPSGYSNIYITHFDCENRPLGWHEHYELAPGWRVITFVGNSQLFVAPNPKSYVMRLEAGGFYTYERRIFPDDWNVIIIDQKTGDPVPSEWYWAEHSYWSGTKPDQELCSSIAEMNE